MTDREQITELLARYADAVNRYDMQAWADVWVEDCTYILDGRPPLNGKDAIVGLFSKSMGGVDAMYQLVNNGLVDVDGDEATGRWFVTEIRALNEKRHDIVVGAYQDRYIKTELGWKFSERQFDQLYVDTRTGTTLGAAFPFPSLKV